MKVVKKIATWIIVIVVLFLSVAYLLPDSYKVSHSRYIRASDQTIYDLVCNLGKWDLWTPWTKEVDSSLKIEISGNDCQVGSKRKWEGKKLNNGEIKITRLSDGNSVSYEFITEKGRFKSNGKIDVMRQGDSCLVRWVAEGKLGNNPLSRYWGLFIDKILGPDFEKGLSKLKNVAEKRALKPGVAVITFINHRIFCG